MPDRPIATVRGTMLVPGVSRNKRLYTKELIGKAVNRMQARIADPAGLPIVMRTHHEAGDNSAMIVGRLTEANLADDGSARYTALLYDTRAGRDIAALITPTKPALRSVSIHGYWLGKLKHVEHEGESVTTCEDLEIDAVDWTATPGVVNATVDSATWHSQQPSTETAAQARTPISESVEATITALTEVVADEGEAAWNSYVEAAYSQKQKDQMVGSGAMRNPQGKGSYPIKTKSDLRRAIRAVGRGGANHNAIRRHVIARAKALGLSALIPSNWNPDGSIKESQIRFGEIREYMDDYAVPGTPTAGLCIDAYNGPVTLTIRACRVDPTQLRDVAAAAMDAACDALAAMDPDMDGDIDIGGVDDGESVAATAGDGEHVLTVENITTYGQPNTFTPGAAAVGTTITVPITADPPAAVTTTDNPAEAGESASTHEEVPAVSEATTSSTEAAETTAQPTRNLTDADITALGAVFAAALKEHAATIPAAPAVETTSTTQAPPSGTTAEQGTTATAETTKAAGVSEKALLERATAIETDLKTKLESDFAARETAMRDAVLSEVRAELLRANGIPTRKGFRVHENEQALPDAQALFDNRTDILLGEFGKTPVPQPGTGTALAATPTQPQVTPAQAQ